MASPDPGRARVVLLVTSHRVAPGLMSLPAWSLVRESPVLTADPGHPQLPALAAAGVDVAVVDASDPRAAARDLRGRATDAGCVVWLVSPGGDEPVAQAVGDLANAERDIDVEVVHASYDVPGARLLDVVATMDRLRSPGGCPWDAEQTHATLAPYLLEEAYEAYQAIEDDDLDALCEELGDVLLQVAFHARVAEDLPPDRRWTIDDVAAGLVDKLVRRHPHVFGEREVSGAEEVVANWDVIKSEEKQGRGALEGVPLAQAALTLAATLQRKAAKEGLPPDLVAAETAQAETPGAAVASAAAAFDDDPGVEALGRLLWAVTALARAHDLDAEAALRGRARLFRDRVTAVERSVREAGLAPRDVDHVEWRARWQEASEE